MQKILWLLILLCAACQHLRVVHDHKVSKKYKDYTVYLDDQRVDPNLYFLDRENISVSLKRKSKEIHLNQIEPRTFITIENFKDKQTKKDWLVIVDGVPVSDDIHIDPKIIKSSIVPDMKQMALCHDPNKSVLVITTMR